MQTEAADAAKSMEKTKTVDKQEQNHYKNKTKNSRKTH